MTDTMATLLFAAFVTHCITVAHLVGKPLLAKKPVDQAELDRKLDRIEEDLRNGR